MWVPIISIYEFIYNEKMKNIHWIDYYPKQIRLSDNIKHRIEYYRIKLPIDNYFT